MADIIQMWTCEPIVLQCEKCSGELLRVLIAEKPRRVIIECAKCGHQAEMNVD